MQRRAAERVNWQQCDSDMTPRAPRQRKYLARRPNVVVTWHFDVARRVGGLGRSLPRRVTAAERARARGAPPRTLQSASAGPRRATAQTRTHAHTHTHTRTHTRSHAYTRAHTRVCHTRTHTPAQEGSERVHSLSGPRDAPRETWPSDSSPVTRRPVFASSAPPMNSSAAPPARALPSVRWRARARAPTHAPEAGGPDAVASQRSFPAKTNRRHRRQVTDVACKKRKRVFRWPRRDVVGPSGFR